MRLSYSLLLAFLVACGSDATSSSGGNPPPPPPGPSVLTINMTDYAYSQPSATIKAGTVVKWVNTGGTSHTATSDGGVSPAFDSGTLGAPGTTQDPYGGTTPTPGGSSSVTFSTPGTYPYHCSFHGTPTSVPVTTMKGTITVNP